MLLERITSDWRRTTQVRLHTGFKPTPSRRPIVHRRPERSLSADVCPGRNPMRVWLSRPPCSPATHTLLRMGYQPLPF